MTGSMLDYALPRADKLPDLEVMSTVTPSPHHPLGLKGIGEAGTIASTVTVYNTVLDALAPLGVETLQMPMTPERVWRAIDGEGEGTTARSDPEESAGVPNGCGVVRCIRLDSITAELVRWPKPATF